MGVAVLAIGTFEQLVELLRGRRVLALTGAGMSTESGIPDYRGPETRRRARNPIQFKEFIGIDEARRRYWARSFVGWPRFAAFQPNPAHYALAELERGGALMGVVTQNVDRLHQRAGSQSVIELHGALEEVICLDCGQLHQRQQLQPRMQRLNPNFFAQQAELAPDGDAEAPPSLTGHFVYPECDQCAGTLKPHVVFFGEGVPKARVDAALRLLDAAEVLLIVGSSLAVFSGFRFPRLAAQLGKPIAIVNLGESRADSLASLRLQARAGELLPRLARALV